MSGKILFVSCGKRNGNTLKAAELAAGGAAAAGAETRLVEAHALRGIGLGCSSCMKCQESKEFGCVFQDDVAKLILQMPDFDILVFCVPVFFFSFGTQAKGIIDRLFSMVKLEGETLHSPLKGKTFALIVTSGGGELDSGVKSVRMSFRNIVEYFQGTDAGELYFPYCDGDRSKDAEMAERAGTFGKMLAENSR